MSAPAQHPTHSLNKSIEQFRTQWLGEEMGSGLSILSIIASDPQPVTEDEIEQAMEFYFGRGQWDESVERMRLDNLRPSVTVNRIPELVTHAVQASLDRGETYNPKQYKIAIAIIVRRNRDAQRLYNYMASTATEIAFPGVRSKGAE